MQSDFINGANVFTAPENLDERILQIEGGAGSVQVTETLGLTGSQDGGKDIRVRPGPSALSGPLAPVDTIAKTNSQKDPLGRLTKESEECRVHHPLLPSK